MNLHGTIRGLAPGLPLLVAGLAQGAEILDLAVVRHEDSYAAEVDVRIHAPVARVRAVVMDYEHLPRLNPSIREVRVLERQGDRHARVRTRARICVLFLCKDLRQVQDIDRDEEGNLMAVTDPRASDLRYGIARWRFWQEPHATRMRFYSEIEPAFWVPPFIGPFLVRHALEREVRTTIDNLERLAKERDRAD
ncbi:MAG: hypothetical protein D6721_08105 [Gammaproteobacteria bacterium]|nr:MAG: hypothetical protein D6721_08105 [Gammaproteobacteria bacterium]